MQPCRTNHDDREKRELAWGMHAMKAVERGEWHWIDRVIGDTDTADDDMQKEGMSRCEATRVRMFTVAPVSMQLRVVDGRSTYGSVSLVQSSHSRVTNTQCERHATHACLIEPEPSYRCWKPKSWLLRTSMWLQMRLI